MKTLFLARHSVPEKNTDVETREIPLSNEGRGKALVFFSGEKFINISRIFVSDYKRAYETAFYSFGNYEIDPRLGERELGNKETFTEESWLNQYLNPDYKNEGGESFSEVKIRMKNAISDILCKMEEGESAVVVSHAAAICSYLMDFCKVEVVDAAKKSRKFTFKEKIVHCGKFNTPSCFCIMYDNNKVVSVNYME